MMARKKLFIQMHSMHGLLRGKNPELGRDEDTGGQITYVLELAKELVKLKDVKKVEIVTRKIEDPKYPGYNKAFEQVSEKVKIVRIPCGGKKYLKKVNLWPHIDEFVENTKKYFKKTKEIPDILQSNYADSGLVCAKLSFELGIPQVHTSHSLGKPKMAKLGVNKKNFSKFNRIFHFDKRIEAEERTIENSDALIVSTFAELEEQYKGYNIDSKSGKVNVVPPGINQNNFSPNTVKPKKHKNHKIARQKIKNILTQNLEDPFKPMLIAISRMDKRKNLISLIRAYAGDKELQKMANLVIFAPAVETAKEEEQKLIDQINNVIQKHNLFGNFCLPSISLKYPGEISELYRVAAREGGVFVNPALIEPFGLTVIEAMGCGLPVAATKFGGPSEIIKNGQDGLLFNPKKPKEIAKTIKRLLKSKKLKRRVVKNALKKVRKKYVWSTCAKSYLRVFKRILEAVEDEKKPKAIGIRVSTNSLLGGLVNEDGKVLAKKSERLKKNESRKGVYKKAARLIRFLKKNREIQGVCFSCSGKISRRMGLISVKKQPNLRNFNIKENMKRISGERIFVENYTNTIALAEAAKNNTKRLAYVSVGSKIEAGFVLDGRLYSDSKATTPNLENFQITVGKKVCVLKNFATIFSIKSSLRKAEIVVSSVKKLNELCNKKEVKRVLESAGTALGCAMAQITQIISPEYIVIGGTLSQNKVVLNSAKKILKKNLTGKYIKIIKAEGSQGLVEIGAALLVLQLNPQN